MPELPEVETIARGLASRVTGDLIESVWLGSKPEPLKSPATEIVATLESQRIAGVRRVGKHIVFDLEPARGLGRAPSPAKGRNQSRRTQSRKRLAGEGARPTQAQWIVHLGMTGRMVVCPPDSEMAKHTHLVAKLASGRELRFVDPRRFEPRKAGLVALLFLHDAHAIPTPVIGVEVDKIRPLLLGSCFNADRRSVGSGQDGKETYGNCNSYCLHSYCM